MTIVAISRLLRSIMALLRRLGHGFIAFFDRVQQARLRAQTFQALAGLSDADLARRGLKREEIAYAVLSASRLRRRS